MLGFSSYSGPGPSRERVKESHLIVECRVINHHPEITLAVSFIDLNLRTPDRIKDELHVLRTCPLYEDFRHSLSPQSKTLLFSDVGQILAYPSRFLTKAHERKPPKVSPKQIPNNNNIA